MKSPEEHEAKSKMRIFHRMGFIVGVVLCVIFGLILLCNLVIIFKSKLHPDLPPALFGMTLMVVQSGSMSGTASDHIEINDLIFVAKTEIEELKVGDIVAFIDRKVIVTHRIQSIQTDENGNLFLITKGDANNVEDDPITKENLIGIYRGRIPKLGRMILFFQEPAGIVVIIGIPIAALGIVKLIQLKKVTSKKNQDD